MKLNEITLTSFAGFADRTVDFDPGLNVICGPNEAGKSTLMSALEVGLFAPHWYRKNSKQHKWLRRFFPRDGGDNFRVHLQGDDNGSPVEITKHYYRSRDNNICRVRHGTRDYGVPEKAEKHLKEILGFGRQTYRTTVLINQGRLDQTVQMLQQRETDSIEQVMRQAVFESEGISVREFEEVLTERLEQKTRYWDMENNQPHRSQRYSRPGAILQAYYRCEDLDSEIQLVKEKQRQVDELKEEIKKAEKQRKSCTEEAESLDEKAGKWEQYREYERVKQKLEEVTRAVRHWDEYEKLAAKYEQKRKEYQGQMDELRKSRSEIKQARRYEKLCDLTEQIDDINQEIEDVAEKLSEHAEITSEDIRKLRSIKSDIDNSEGRLEALQLVAEVQPAEGISCRISTGLDGEEVKVCGAENFQARGRIRIKVPDVLQLEVRPADADLEQIEADLTEGRQKLQKMLQSLGCSDIEEAESVQKKRTELTRKKERLENIRTSRLQAYEVESLSDVQEELTEIKKGPNRFLDGETPSDEDLDDSLDSLQKQLSEFERDNLPKKQEFAKWQEEYSGFNSALTENAKMRGKLNELGEQLPEKFEPDQMQYDSPQKMRSRANHLRNQAENMGERIHELELNLQRERQFLQENSLKDLQKQREKAGRTFETEKERARSLTRVKEAFVKVKNELDEETFDGLKRSFADFLSSITDGRYQIGQMSGLQPQQLMRSDERVQFPLHLLSAGTRDCAALSLRLAIAAETFEEGNSFLLMDEPLINFDPERKSYASELIERFVKRGYQVLVFSCDSETINLLEASAGGFHQFDRRI